MIVVSNSSPLVSLGAIGRFELLRDLYGGIAVPRAVHHEVAVQGTGRPGAVEVQSFDWITVCDINSPYVVTALQGKLDQGEAEAIALALELPADLLLMDERLGGIERFSGA
jgi:predicted nucleic acid-binding protein